MKKFLILIVITSFSQIFPVMIHKPHDDSHEEVLSLAENNLESCTGKNKNDHCDHFFQKGVVVGVKPGSCKHSGYYEKLICRRRR